MAQAFVVQEGTDVKDAASKAEKKIREDIHKKLPKAIIAVMEHDFSNDARVLAYLKNVHNFEFKP